MQKKKIILQFSKMAKVGFDLSVNSTSYDQTGTQCLNTTIMVTLYMYVRMYALCRR